MSRRISFVLALAVLALGVVEAASHGILWWAEGSAFSLAESDALRQLLEREAAPPEAPRAPEEEDPEGWLRRQVIHPYFGFAVDPERGGDGQGFLNKSYPVGPDVVRVAIFGGSVAQGLARRDHATLVRGLSRVAAFRGRRIVVLSYALGGFKQPQQLMVLNYLLTEGRQFDVVINLDGFNEVALPAAENLPRGVSALYPRGWELRVGSIDDLSQRRLVGEITLLRERRAERGGWCAKWPLRWSASCDLVWRRLDHGLAAQLAETQQRLALHTSDTRMFRSHGPEAARLPPEELFRELAAVWMRASLLMDRISEADGARYYHFLQPNQYVEGSKPMGRKERRKAINPDSRYRAAVERGYPALVGAGAELVAAGVSFHDMRRVFADVPEALYRDHCCHFNGRGNRILAERMADLIVKDLETRPLRTR